MMSKRLMSLMGESKKHVIMTILWNWGALIANVLFFFSIASLLQTAWNGEISEAVLMRTAAAVIMALVLRTICSRQAVKASFYASVQVKMTLRRKIYEKLLRLGASYHQKVSTAEVVQVSVEGVEQLEIYFGKYLPQLFYSLLAPVTLFAVFAFIDLRAAVVLLVCVPLIPMSIVAVQKFAKKLLSKYWGIYTGLGDHFLENIQGLTTLKIFQADERTAREMDVEAERFRKITMKVLTMQLNSISVMDLVAYGGAAAGIITAVVNFQAGRTSLFGVIAVLLLASEFFIPLRLLGSFFHIAMNGMAASDKIFRLLDMEEPETGTESISAGSDIVFDKVSFAYEEERPILEKISLSVPSGSFTAFAGVSGCGKSTLAALIMGIEKGYNGSIRIGNKELSDISEKSIMENLTLISHNSYLFKGTVEDNLLMGNAAASEKQMKQVLREVNLWSFFETQEGLQTKLSEKASNLSGGQCQRLGLARALLHDTPVYIFDEATSNIDVESENQIMKVIQRLKGKKTVIMISHRLANITGADHIYVISDRKVAERGTHESLLAKQALYHKMYEKQRNLEKYNTMQEGCGEYA